MSGDGGDGDDDGGGGEEAGKRTRRRALLDARRARSGAERRDATAALVAGVGALLAGAGPGPICAFVPVGSEPGAAPPAGGTAATAVPDALLAAGRTVLLPVTVGSVPLDWAAYDGSAPRGSASTGSGSLGRGPHGLLEPVGRRLGADAVTRAALVLVPALAVDRRGTRLGRGGGHYDRTLALLGDATRRVALVGDDELVDEPLPALAHDVAVHAVWRPHHGVTELGVVNGAGTRRR